MINRKELKKRARHSLRSHFAMWVLVCILAMLFGGEALFYNDFSETEYREIVTRGDYIQLYGFGERVADIIKDISFDNMEQSKQDAQEYIQQSKQDGADKGFLSHSQGVFAGIVNRVSSGSFILVLASAIHSVIGSARVTTAILVVFGLMLVFAVWCFFLNVFTVIKARMFLEGLSYEKVRLYRLRYLFKTGCWFNVSKVMLIEQVYLMLWDLTIIGGMIKRYSYFIVPYIMAENPTISAKTAIKMSRDMMNGHKWECFVLRLSFIGWELLSSLTFGALNVLYVRPYQESTYCEYYSVLRKMGKAKGLDNIDLLNDDYLYATASDEVIAATYADVISTLKESGEGDEKDVNGVERILTKFFGVTLKATKAQQEMVSRQVKQQAFFFEKEECDKEAYPVRLCTFTKSSKSEKPFQFNVFRCYSIWSVIMIFFTTSFIGWLWEVAMHVVMDGKFVNRGVMHGPWLPIYGAGGVLILIFLYRFRQSPVKEFTATIVLCGIVEYFTAFFLEKLSGGTRWWDYTGYFLNIHGRVCAEGLLVFGIGGMAIVYFLAPKLDDLFKKIKPSRLIVICVVLLTLFTADGVYSAKFPNEGKGVTYTAEDIAARSSQSESKEVTKP